MRAYAQSSQYHTIARESCSSNRMNEPILHPKNEMSIKYLKIRVGLWGNIMKCLKVVNIISSLWRVVFIQPNE